jgi:hypothetical protein
MSIGHRAGPNCVDATALLSQAVGRHAAGASRQMPDSAPSAAPPEPTALAAAPLPGSRQPQTHGANAFQPPRSRLPSPSGIGDTTLSP